MSQPTSSRYLALRPRRNGWSFYQRKLAEFLEQRRWTSVRYPWLGVEHTQLTFEHFVAIMEESSMGKPTGPTIKFEPTGGRVAIQRVAETESVGGIYIPEKARSEPTEGIVIAVPAKVRQQKNGPWVASEVKPGDHVIFEKYSETEVEIDGVKVLLIQEYHILAIVSAE